MTTGKPPSDRRTTPAEWLESWKEIAAYFKRGVRTVRRWEKEEGLPVHRQVHKTLGTVYARISELEAWREGRRARVPKADAVAYRSRKDSTRVMIAVLPFANLSGDSDQEYIADGLTEEMTSQLGRLNPETLGVIARTTVMRYKAAGRTVRQIGDELKVDYVIEGSVRREADRVRVSAQLIHVGDQTHLWSGTYEHAVRSILALQRELAADIGREIRLKLSPQRAAMPGKAGSVHPDAYYDHLKGRHFLNDFTPESIRRSLEYFQRAIALDPAYAPSYASLAEAYEQLPLWVAQRPTETFHLALEAANKALELDAGLPDAHASLGLINANYLWDWSKAERHFQRALELNPGCSPARQWYAEFLAEMGRIDDALETIERAHSYDPLSRAIQATRAFVLWLGRRFDEAIAQADRVLELDPHYPMALIRLGVAYSAKGMHAHAVRAFRKAEKAAPELPDSIALLGHTYAIAGNKRAALKQLDELGSLAERRYVPAFLFAEVYLGLGDLDEALRLLEQEYDARGWYLLMLKQGPQFDPLRSHPRFHALMSRMNFPNPSISP